MNSTDVIVAIALGVLLSVLLPWLAATVFG
jgi:hypothetical protein